jgi:hypothetical protein
MRPDTDLGPGMADTAANAIAFALCKDRSWRWRLSRTAARSLGNRRSPGREHG